MLGRKGQGPVEHGHSEPKMITMYSAGPPPPRPAPTNQLLSVFQETREQSVAILLGRPS